MIFKTNINKTVQYFLVYLSIVIYLVESYTIIQIDDDKPVLVQNKEDHIKILKEVKRTVDKYKKIKKYINDFFEDNLTDYFPNLRDSMLPYNLHLKNKRKQKLMLPSLEPYNSHKRDSKLKSRQPRDINSKNLMVISTNVKHGGPSKIRRELNENLKYIPLFRIHNDEKVKHNDINQNIVKIIYPKIKKLRDGTYAKIQSKENEDVLNTLRKLIKAYKQRSKLQSYLKQYSIDIEKLRVGKFIDQSGEIYDPLAPGINVLDYGHDADFAITEQKPLYLHEYTPWDWWTYPKLVIQDKCPGELVRVGDKCVYTPPH